MGSDESTQANSSAEKGAFGWFVFGILKSHSRLYLLYTFIASYSCSTNNLHAAPGSVRGWDKLVKKIIKLKRRH